MIDMRAGICGSVSVLHGAAKERSAALCFSATPSYGVFLGLCKHNVPRVRAHISLSELRH